MLQMDLLIGKTVANKTSEIFLRIILNICKIKLTPSSFSYIYICLYFLSMWSSATFYHLLNRFPQPNDNCTSTS